MYLEISHDDDAESPREYDNTAVMACSHPRYSLGDYQLESGRNHPLAEVLEHEDLGSVPCVIEEYTDNALYDLLTTVYGLDHEEASKRVAERYAELITEYFDKHFYSKPLFLYDHSGITINTGGFSCPWDSGQVGIAYIKRADYPDYSDEQLDAIIESEVSVYREFLEGNVWGYVLRDDNGDDVDSCWGFIGDWENCGIQGYLDQSKITKIYNTVFEEEVSVEDFFNQGASS